MVRHQGYIRQHQFEKVEMVQFVHPYQSWGALEELVGHAKLFSRNWACHTAPWCSVVATWFLCRQDLRY